MKAAEPPRATYGRASRRSTAAAAAGGIEGPFANVPPPPAAALDAPRPALAQGTHRSAGFLLTCAAAGGIYRSTKSRSLAVSR
jgi:hypothetical protein